MLKLFGKKLGKYQFSLNPHKIEHITPVKDNKNKIMLKHKIAIFKNSDLNEVILMKKLKKHFSLIIFSRKIQSLNKIIIINNWIKDKLEATKNESISEDWKICKILTDRVDGVDGAKSNDISTTDDENAMIMKITSLIFL